MTQRISICPHCRDTYPDFDVAHVCSRGPYAPKLKLKKNERIKLLAEQAGYSKDYLEIGLPSNMEKFAELIVKECTKAVMDGTKEGDHYAQRIEHHFDNGAGGVLHFGVEE